MKLFRTSGSPDQFGINMKRFCRAHEAEVAEALRAGGDPRAALTWHLEKLRWLQHERLIHLIVLCLTAAATLFCAGLAMLHPEIGLGPAIALLILAVLLGFYFAHYFFLENTVQHWYRLAEQLMAAGDERKND